MSRFSGAIEQVSITGAASRIRLYWPSDPNSPSAAVTISKYDRQPLTTITQTASGGSLTAAIVYSGADCIEQVIAAGGNLQWLKLTRNMSLFTERTAGMVNDEYSCFSIRATLAWDNIANASISDIGLAMFCGNLNNQLFSAAPKNSGITFGPTDIATIALRAMKGGATTVNEVVAAGLTPTLTNWNTFELRCVSGSPTSDPVMFGLINGQPVTQKYSWTAAVGLLPPPNVYGQHGYLLGVGCANPNANANLIHQYIHEICWTAAGSEAALI